jgi:hypothetical protein
MQFQSVEMPENARIWIYTSNRMLTPGEVTKLNAAMSAFTDDWTAHGAKMKATHIVLHDSVLVLVADEQKAAASGCSIDDSVRTIKAMGEELGVDFFNRHRVVFQNQGGEWENKSAADFWALRKAEVVLESTRLVNPLCTNWKEFVEDGEIEFAKSWHQKMWGR